MLAELQNQPAGLGGEDANLTAGGACKLGEATQMIGLKIVSAVWGALLVCSYETTRACF